MQHINLNPQIINRLESDFNMVPRGSHLRGGECPDCGKKTLWTWVDKPGRVQCDRTNNCNFSATSKELFPDLFERINERYKPTAENPNATADAYLSLIRGIDPSAVKGWYDQNKYWHPNGNKGTASVRFYLTADKQTYWERLIDTVTITDDDGSTEERNKSFKGAFKGLWWQPPQLTINKDDTIYFCEGILDAISLNLNGLKAVAIMSSGTFPHDAIKPHLGQNVEWVLALDNDKTGRRFTKKHGQKLRDMGERVTAMLSSESDEKADWNDLHRAKKLTEQDINQYRYLGGLELAISYREKAQMIWQHNISQNKYVMDYANRTYSVAVDKSEHEKAMTMYAAGIVGVDPVQITTEELNAIIDELKPEDKHEMTLHAFGQASKIKEIGTFAIDYLYYQQPDNGEDGQYFFRFTLSNHNEERQIAFTHKTISAASDFKKSSMRIPGALFTGSTYDLDWLYKHWTRQNTKEVRTLDYIGYDKTTKTYVFKDFAVEGAKVHKLNNQSFFQLKKQGVKTMVDIKQSLSTKNNVEWIADFKTAFGTKGLVSLAWWFGTLFVEQVRQQHRSYPFFELVGEAASGKSSLVDFMWKLYGKEGESFNPNSSTLAGRTRKMAEVSNLPVVFNETDNEDGINSHVKKFNWDEIKDLFDGEFGRVTGIKSQDNSTKKPAFKAGLMIVQNVPVMASEAIITRIVHLNFDTSHHSSEGYAASVRLNNQPVNELNGFIINATKQADRVLKHFNQQLQKHRAKLQTNRDIKLQRIIENHAKIMAFFDCLKGLIPEIAEQDVIEVHAMLETMAATRQASLNEDSQLLQQFWNQFHYLDSKPRESSRDIELLATENQMNHSAKPAQEIAVNLEHYHGMCALHNQPRIEPIELRKQLAGSKRHKFIVSKVVNSNIENRSVRCWVFDRKGV